MINFKLALLAAGGGAFGSAARYLWQTVALRLFGPDFPWGTLSVNVAGCFMMGAVSGLAIHRSMFGPELRLFLTTGFLGGFTTFSAFALDTAFLAEKSAALSASYMAASVVASIGALYGGIELAKLSL